MEEVINQSAIDLKSVKSELETMIVMIDSQIDSVRRIATELRQGVLNHPGLFPAIEWQISQFRMRRKKIILADDHSVVRNGIIKSLTFSFPHAEFGEADNSIELLRIIDQTQWNLLILILVTCRSGSDFLIFHFLFPNFSHSHLLFFLT